MAISSNYLNLPTKISSTTAGVTDKIEYLYNAQGAKLAKKVNGLAEEEHYMGNLVIKKNGTTFTVNYLMHSEGLVTKTTTAYVYEYFAKDHLGNTRVKYKDVNGVATVQQATDYYPFGLAFTPITPNDGNKYLYNGKELQDNAIGGVNLDWYDYGARMYDPQIGRWHVPDLLAEYHYNMTPYHYCLNNPMRYIDPFGLDTLPVDPNTGLPNKDIEEVTVTPSSSADQKFGNPSYGNGVDHDWGTAEHQGNPYHHDDSKLGVQAGILQWIVNLFKKKDNDDSNSDTDKKPGETTSDKEIKQEKTGIGEDPVEQRLRVTDEWNYKDKHYDINAVDSVYETPIDNNKHRIDSVRRTETDNKTGKTTSRTIIWSN